MTTERMRLTAAPRYHRNGVAGEGFFALSFAWKPAGERAWRPMLAVAFYDDEDELGHRPRTARIAIVNPADPRETYRGDCFEAQIRQWVDVACATGAAFRADGRRYEPAPERLHPRL